MTDCENTVGAGTFPLKIATHLGGNLAFLGGPPCPKVFHWVFDDECMANSDIGTLLALSQRTGK